MALDFDAFIERQMKDDFPEKLHRFLRPQQNPSAFERTWGYYSFAFESAFEMMARDYCERYPAQDYLLIPLTSLARHSMELSLKYALTECTFFARKPLKIKGHGLLVLNDRLDKFLIDKGFIEGGDEWNKRTRSVLAHIDNVDRSGEAFRYSSGSVRQYVRSCRHRHGGSHRRSSSRYDIGGRHSNDAPGDWRISIRLIQQFETALCLRLRIDKRFEDHCGKRDQAGTVAAFMSANRLVLRSLKYSFESKCDFDPQSSKCFVKGG